MAEAIFKVQGHPENELVFFPFTSCGNIEDGVGFANGQRAGGYVIAYKDLLQMVKLAKQARRPTKRAPDAPKRGAKVVKSKSKVISGHARR